MARDRKGRRGRRSVLALNQGSGSFGRSSTMALNQPGGTFGAGRPAGGGGEKSFASSSGLGGPLFSALMPPPSVPHPPAMGPPPIMPPAIPPQAPGPQAPQGPRFPTFQPGPTPPSLPAGPQSPTISSLVSSPHAAANLPWFAPLTMQQPDPRRRISGFQF